MPRKPREIICPYCDKPAEQVTGKEIYPERYDLWDRNYWRCVPCDAYVGCHIHTTRPLGRMANAAQRKAKRIAHSRFDVVWKSGQFDRKGAYAWLASRMGLTAKECHIGMMNEEQCAEVVRHVDALLGTMPTEDV
jgi:hypothetical protein